MIAWIVPLAILAAWAAAGGIVPAWLLPPPAAVVKAVWSYVFHVPGSAPFAGRFAADSMASLARVGVGFALAVAVGLPLGLVSGRVRPVREALGPLLSGLRAVPGIAWLPLALVWFGIGIEATLFLVGLAAFFPIYLNAASGAAGIEPGLLQAGRMMGLGRVELLRRVIVPAAMPRIVTGLRLALGVSWAYLVLGELTGVEHGLGAMIMDARMQGRVEMVIAGMLVIATLGRAGDRLLVGALKACSRSARRLA